MLADVIIKNGKCVTMEEAGQCFDWVAVRNQRILDLGYGEDFESYLSEDTVIVDAEGHTVLPGFIDSHFHVIQTAFNAVSLNLSDVKSLAEISTRIKEAAIAHPGEMIRGYGLSLDGLREDKQLTRNMLDQCCDDVPVWINSKEYQVSILNTYALLYFKIPFTTVGIELDERSMPTGVFRRNANSLLRTNILDSFSDEFRFDTVNQLMPTLLEKGITTINAMEGGTCYSDKDAEFIYHHGKDFPIDMVLFYQTMDIEKVKKKGLKRIGGSLYIDGTIENRTAALSFEYEDCPGTMGTLCLSQQQLNDFVLECYENEIQLALYTIGDRAIEAALTAHVQAMYQVGTTALRHRLEHVELATEEQVERAKRLNLIFSMQPSYELDCGGKGGIYERRLGSRYRLTNAFREIMEKGVRICGGSDSDVTEANPLLGISAAVNHPVEEHRIDVYDALRMFTCEGAYAIFEEENKGTLKKGKLADIIVLDCDIFEAEKERLKDIKVTMTMKSGDIIYERF